MTNDVGSLAGTVTALGLLVTFSVLICIIVIIVIYPKILKLFMRDKQAEEKKTKAPESAPVQTAPAAQNDDKELIAVITAAIACMMGKSPSGLVVKSYKRVGSNWKRSGRESQIKKY